MLRALYTAATGMSAQQMNLDNVANNLANSSTAGFRRQQLPTQDLIYQNLVMPRARPQLSRRPWSQGCRSAWARVRLLPRLCRCRETRAPQAALWILPSRATDSFR